MIVSAHVGFRCLRDCSITQCRALCAARHDTDVLCHESTIRGEGSYFHVSRSRKKDRSDLAAATSNYTVEAIMKLIPLLAVFVSLPGVAADSATPSNATTALLEQGKKIFVARCAKCHDNDANKKLSDGTTLLGRLAKIKDPEARLGTRLKDPQECHAVKIYVDSLLKSLQSSSQ
jgi:hypothetical protein